MLLWKFWVYLVKSAFPKALLSLPPFNRNPSNEDNFEYNRNYNPIFSTKKDFKYLRYLNFETWNTNTFSVLWTKFSTSIANLISLDLCTINHLGIQFIFSKYTMLRITETTFLICKLNIAIFDKSRINTFIRIKNHVSFLDKYTDNLRVYRAITRLNLLSPNSSPVSMSSWKIVSRGPKVYKTPNSPIAQFSKGPISHLVTAIGIGDCLNIQLWTHCAFNVIAELLRTTVSNAFRRSQCFGFLWSLIFAFNWQ